MIWFNQKNKINFCWFSKSNPIFKFLHSIKILLVLMAIQYVQLSNSSRLSDLWRQLKIWKMPQNAFQLLCFFVVCITCPWTSKFISVVSWKCSGVIWSNLRSIGFLSIFLLSLTKCLDHFVISFRWLDSSRSILMQ